MKKPSHTLRLSVAAFALLMSGTAAQAGDIDAKALLDRLNRLEAANAELKAQLVNLSQQQEQTEAKTNAVAVKIDAQEVASADGDLDPQHVVGINPEYGYAMLDHAEGVNKRQIMLLKARQNGELDSMVTLSGAVTAIANAHISNRPNKFGYLMRHPSGNNQRTRHTQEITINSAQLAVTVTPTPDVSAYIEMLYDPEQSFGAGTLTALARNQVQVRKAYVMFGNLDKSPLYMAAGKMDVPFGLQDTVSPFTNSTNWHAFAPLAYGGQVGYHTDSLSVRAMAVLGGAQFRSANTPVDGTAIPSKVNNFSVDGSYTLGFGDDNSLMVGGSYLHGSAYCQAYPIFHFNPCSVRVPAWAAYSQLDMGDLRLLGEIAKTTKIWPGTKVPLPGNPLAVFDASKVTAITLGGRYSPSKLLPKTDLSLEFSTFIAGPDNSPWERQNQWVLGLSHKLAPSVDVFGEVIRTEGFAPLNFLTGGNQPNGGTWSDRDARSSVLMLGVQAAF